MDERTRPDDGPRVAADWLDVLDGLSDALKGAANGVADIADDAVRLWENLSNDVVDLGSSLDDIGREISGWSSRVARTASSGWVLAQITSSYRLQDIIAGFHSAEGAATAMRELHARNARRFYQAAVSLGGGFVKVGQLLSARMDLLPESWVHELAGLQDAVPPADFSAVRSIIEEDLGGPLDQLFAQFEQKPVAAASIGQVYRAVTHDGRVVAVKVQRPGIREVVELDLTIFELGLDAMKSMFPPTDYDTIVAEVRAMLLAELDYANEAQMMARVADFFDDHPAIIVPRPILGLCGKRVFASDFVEGRKITDVLDEWQRSGEVGRPRIARVLGVLLECYARQVLQAGVFQADPHPGNLLVTSNDELVLLDFGCTRLMDDDLRSRYLALVGCFISGDRAATAAVLQDLGFATRSGRPETLHAFADAILHGFRKVLSEGAELAWMSQDQVFEQAARLLDTADDDPVTRMPGEFVMLARVFGTLGGLFHHYQPEIDYREHLLPVVGAAMAKRAKG